jgi:hypothetical protein
VHLEINRMLTVSGRVAVCDGVLTFEPGVDARLIGRQRFSIRLADIVQLERRDSDRRVVIATRSDVVILRGIGAQRAWLSIMISRDESASLGGSSCRLFEAGPDAPPGRSTLYALSPRGFGFAGEGWFGAARSGWYAYDELLSARQEGNTVELATRRGPILLEDAATPQVLAALPGAIAASLPDNGPELPLRAVLTRDRGFCLGELSLASDGLCFAGADGTQLLLAARGTAAEVEAFDQDRFVVRSPGDAGQRMFVGPDPDGAVRILRVLLESIEWRTADRTRPAKALTPSVLTLITCLPQRMRLLAGDIVLAEAHETPFIPQETRVRARAVLLERPPTFPLITTIELNSSRGRFVIPARLDAVEPAQPMDAPPDVGEMGTFHLTFTGGVQRENRRRYYRLPLGEWWEALSTPASGSGRPLTMRTWVLNLSRSGCLLRAPRELMVGEPIVLEPEPGEHAAPLHGYVLHATRTDDGWLCGVRFNGDSEAHAAELFGARERRLLQERSRQREREGAP